MAFRNPTYLDMELLSNLADYIGIGLPEETNVIRRSTQEGTKGVGVEKVVNAKLQRANTQELTESFSVNQRPVRLLNDLIDSMEATSDLVDLDADPDAVVASRSVLQLTGDLVPSAANEVGSIMARFLPMLIQKLGEGATDFDFSDAEVARMFTTTEAVSGPQLFEIETDQPADRPRFLVLMEAKYLNGPSSLDDIEGEQTIVAHVDRIVKEGADVSLEKYLLPGLPRVMRRALGSGGVGEMVSGLDEVLGREIDPDELVVHGPAYFLRPLAIF